MSNVFTKKHKRPRTTTLTDFGKVPMSTFSASMGGHPRRPRVLSPTRRMCPHPTGLVSQKPYNKDNLIFHCWNPSFERITRRMPTMIQHVEQGNFSCGNVLPALEKSSAPPEIKYTLCSMSRMKYQPPAIPANFKHLQNTTRFGHSPYKPAKGIAPNTKPPVYYRPAEEERGPTQVQC